MNLYCDNIYSARELYSVGKYMSMMSLISFPQRFLINCPKYQLPNNVALYSLQWLLINYVTQIHIMKYTKQIYIFFKSASICVFTDNSIILTFDNVFFFLLVCWDTSNSTVIYISTTRVRCQFDFIFWNNKNEKLTHYHQGNQPDAQLELKPL